MQIDQQIFLRRTAIVALTQADTLIRDFSF